MATSRPRSCSATLSTAAKTCHHGKVCQLTHTASAKHDEKYACASLQAAQPPSESTTHNASGITPDR